MFVRANPNPVNNLVGDCVIRAISISTGLSWDDVYDDLADLGHDMYNMPSANEVWGMYLKRIGYVRRPLPNTCPVCYTLKDFTKDYPRGRYIVATGSHVIAVTNGDYYDTWDSGDEVVTYYFERRK